MARKYTPMTIHITTYRTNDKCQNDNFTKPVLLKYKLLKRTGLNFVVQLLLCALFDMAVVSVMRSVFEMRTVRV
jgi:hypothetical protein